MTNHKTPSFENYFINFMLIDDASQYVYYSFPFGE